MWWFRWHARRFFRSVMNPMDPAVALKWTARLRVLYIFIAFNAVIVSYKYYTKTTDHLKEKGLFVEDKTPSHARARLMQLQDIHIIRTGVGRPTEEYTINVEEYRKDFERQQEEKRQQYLVQKKAMSEKSEELKD
ncbi:unnamed protein product [Oppiella nova]|uniref:Uncharacterized protein n=1 Tax=Oppiella nova TaxID=334625 RepID=A0A7R9MH17_9ACAR|nr:unnamed protein product [Oppiella nova]CAG2177242.1 unnamed protein product [Oppiella nova]